MFNLQTVWLFLVLALWPEGLSAAEAPKWICVADQATGFAFKNGAWQSANFNVKDNKYILIKKNNNYIIKTMGMKASVKCNTGNMDKGFICENIIEKFYISFNTQRYLKIFNLGYVNGLDRKGGATPYLEIGKCSPL